MDPFTQSTFGAAAAVTSTRAAELRAGAAAGLLSGLAPDLDVLIRSTADPLLFLEYHRQFTHALAMVPLGALACAAVTYPLLRRWLALPRLYLCCLLGYGSHGLLDACTSYGTQLLWPFSNARIAWNVVSVVDPLFTVPLAALLAMSLVRRRRGWALAALVWAAIYLTLGVVQGGRAEQAARTLAAARGHEVVQLLVKPSFGNLLLWKSVYEAGGWYHVDALRLAASPTMYAGERVRTLATDPRWRPPPAGSRQGQDLERFRRFSGGYLALAEDGGDTVIDVRYSMVPNRIDGLWGIVLDRGEPQAHARFVTDRTTTAEQRRSLTRMLTEPGRPLPESD